jgi:hypothetical protein
MSCDNTKAAPRNLAKAFVKRKVGLVVVEATGGYEVVVMAALAAEDQNVVQQQIGTVLKHGATSLSSRTPPHAARVN